MHIQEVNLLEELDSISQIHFLKRDDIDTMMVDMAKRLVIALKIERLSVWLFNPDKTSIVSIGEYDSRTKIFTKDSVLKKENLPIYFDALQENKIIIADDIYSHPYTMEFTDIYSKPNNVFSLLDIPIRITGNLVGVMCFEKTGIHKKFNKDEISFCLSISQVLASNLEARKRRVVQEKLELALNEKDLLIREINHRVKNNLTILISLMRISKFHTHVNESKVLLDEYEQRIFSMLKIHDMLNKNNTFLSINLSDYVKELVLEFENTYPQIKHAFNDDIIHLEFLISTKKAIHLGLIVSEIILNSIKYASTTTNNYEILIHLNKLNDTTVEIKIGDNGKGFNFVENVTNPTLGLSLIKDLAISLDSRTVYPTLNFCYYTFEIHID